MLAKNLIFLLYFSLFTANAQSKADDILGNWMSSDNLVAVKIFKTNNQYRANVIWFDVHQGSGKPINTRVDSNNPDPNLRTRKIIGMEILEGLQYNSQQQTWENGKIYDATSGRHWDSSVSLTSEGIMKVRGYWRFKWIGKSMSFRKIK